MKTDNEFFSIDGEHNEKLSVEIEHPDPDSGLDSKYFRITVIQRHYYGVRKADCKLTIGEIKSLADHLTSLLK